MKQSELKKIADTCVNKITKNGFYREPYKHLIVDNFLPDDLAQKCMDNFPELSSDVWEHENDDGIEVKSRTTWKSEFDIPDDIVDSVRILNSSLVLNAFSNSTVNFVESILSPVFINSPIHFIPKNNNNPIIIIDKI